MSGMGEQPLITIIVPIYNGAVYIRECIQSIIRQDYDNLEIILVDDGSEDDSLNIMMQYRLEDDRIMVLQQKNAGVSTARNHALRNAHGKFVAFIDQDDCIASDYVTYFYNMLIKANADIALCPKARRFVMGMPKVSEENCHPDTVEIVSGQEAAIRMLYYKIIIGPWNKMISLELIKKYKIWFNEDFFGGEGFAFSVMCMQRAERVAIGCREVYYYRVDNPNSGTTRFSLKLIESSICAQQYIKDNLIITTTELLRACDYARWHTYCDCYNMIVGCKVKYRNEELYCKVKQVCKGEAYGKWKAPITLKERIKAIMFWLNPRIAAEIINKQRMRRFTVEDSL